MVYVTELKNTFKKKLCIFIALWCQFQCTKKESYLSASLAHLLQFVHVHMCHYSSGKYP